MSITYVQQHRPIHSALVGLLVGACVGVLVGTADARQDDYVAQIVAASKQRLIEHPPEVFASLRVIGSGISRRSSSRMARAARDRSRWCGLRP